MAYIIITSWFGMAHIYWWGPERSWRLCSRLSIGLLGGTWLGTIHGVRTHLCKVLRPIKGCGLTKHPYLGIQSPWVIMCSSMIGTLQQSAGLLDPSAAQTRPCQVHNSPIFGPIWAQTENQVHLAFVTLVVYENRPETLFVQPLMASRTAHRLCTVSICATCSIFLSSFVIFLFPGMPMARI